MVARSPSAFFVGSAGGRSTTVQATQEPAALAQGRPQGAAAAAAAVAQVSQMSPPLQLAEQHLSSGFRFPNCRAVLWDASAQASKVFVGAEDVLPDVAVPAHVLARLPGALSDTAAPLGALSSTLRPAARDASPVYEVHGYAEGGSGGDANGGGGGLALAISNADAEDPEAARAAREAAQRACLADRSPTSVDALLRPHLSAAIAQPSATSDQYRLSVSAEVLAPSATLVATPIRSLRILPTPLSKSLAAAQSVRAGAGGSGCSEHSDDMRAGYVTVDACRRCVAMHVKDAKTWEWPMVGVWVSDVESVYDSLVWAACVRFCHCASISERVSQNGAFLLLLYVRDKRSPQMYEWRLSPTVEDGDATPLEFELFTTPLELPLSALRTNAVAEAPFEFPLGRKAMAGSRGDSSRSEPVTEAVDTMACPEPSAPPSPATLSFVAAATASQPPPAWSPMRVQPDALPLKQAEAAAVAAAAPAAANLLPTQQVATQQAKIDNLEAVVRQLQQQLMVLTQQHVKPSSMAATDAAGTNTSFIWQQAAVQHQLCVLNQGAPPKAAVPAATNTSFLWQQELPAAAATVPAAAAELQQAMSRFGASQPDSVDASEPTNRQHVDSNAMRSFAEGVRSRVDPVRSPARSRETERELIVSAEHAAQRTSLRLAYCHTYPGAEPADSASSDDDERFADRGDPATPARPVHTMRLPSAAATPPSPPEPVWRSMAHFCDNLNVSTIGKYPRLLSPKNNCASDHRHSVPL